MGETRSCFPRPPSPLEKRVPRRVLLLLGLEGRLHRRDLDLLRPRLLALRQLDGEYTVVERGRGVLVVDVRRDREGADELPVAPLDAVVVLVAVVLLELALALEGEDAVFESNLDLV